jgi:hypothetical protein
VRYGRERLKIPALLETFVLDFIAGNKNPAAQAAGNTFAIALK